MKKKLVAILLAAILLVTLFPITALADNPHVVQVFNEPVQFLGYRVRISTSTTCGTTEEQGGTISNNKNRMYLASQGSWTFTATPKTGYKFDGWTINGGPAGAFSISGNTLTVTYIDNSQNYHATANFHQVQTFTLATAVSPAGGGTVDKSPNQSTFTEGQNAVLTARPNTGWQFDGWSGDASGSTNPLTVAMNSGKSITANFSQIDYNITFAPGDYGTLSGQTSYTLHYGDPFPAAPTINPIPGYTANGWSPNLPSNVPEGGGTYTARYNAIPYTVNFAAGVGGTLSGNTSYTNQNYYSAFPAAPTPIPNDGYTFANWLPDFPDKVYTGGTYTANFTFTGYTVNLDLGMGGTFNSNGSNAITLTGVPAGSLSIPAYTINDGYKLTGWSGSTDIYGSTTLTARYEYRVTFVGNDQITITGTNPVWTNGPNVIAPAYTAASGYRFDGWDKSLSGITGPTTITAKAAVRQCTLTLLVSNGYYGYAWDPKTSRSYTYDVGTTVNLGNYYPWSLTGYFVRWVEKGTGVKYYSYYKNITLTGDTTYTAVFELGRYDQYVYTTAGANGKLNNDLSGSYSSGARINLNTAQPTATKEGYEFKYWEEYIDSTGSWVRVSENSSGEAWVTVGEVNDYRAIFGIKEFTVSFYEADGTTLIEAKTVTWGNPVTAPTAAIVEGKDFSSWTLTGSDAAYADSLGAVKENLKAVATYTDKTFTVSFYEADGTTLIEAKTVTWGNPVTAPTAAAIEGKDFSSWMLTGSDAAYADSLGAVKENLKAVATYTDKIYTVNFYEADGTTLIETKTVTWGNPVTAPTAAAVEGKDFSNWTLTGSDAAYTDSLGAVKENLKAVATYTYKTYTVSFYEADGTTLIEAKTVTWGNPVTAPTAATVEGKDFSSWTLTGSDAAYTDSLGAVKENLKAVATYTDKIFTVSFYEADGTTLIEDKTVTWGNPVTAPTAAAVEGKDFSSWTLTGSDAAYTDSLGAVKENLKAVATYTYKTYTVSFYQADGTTQIGTTQTVNWGSAATFETAPAITGYAFDQWVLTGDDNTVATSLTIVRENIKAAASYIRNGYTVTFVDYNGNVIGTDGVLYGDAAVAPEVPARDGYTFTGWNTAFNYVTSNLTVTALYNINTYMVTFVDYNGVVLSTQTVDWNSAATAPADPSRTGYRFTGWGTDFSSVKGNLTVTAQYVRRTYTVTFLDYDGTTIDTQTVRWNDGATAPAAPEREGYTFTGWDTSFDPVTSNLTVTALYSINTYTVAFVDFDGTELATQTVDWNTAATAPADPSREGFEFTGWDTAFDAVRANLTVTAQYAEVIPDEEIPDTNGTIEDEPVPAAGGGFAWWWIPIIVGAAAVLFFLIFFVVRRKKKEEENA